MSGSLRAGQGRRGATRAIGALLTSGILAACSGSAAETGPGAEALADVSARWADGSFAEVRPDPGEVDLLVVEAGEDMPECPGVRLDPADREAVYCRDADTVVVDARTAARLSADHGPLALPLVVAHHYGHALQARRPVEDLRPIVAELQADCLAGAWAAPATGRDGAWADSTDRLGEAVLGLLSIADARGEVLQGSGLDRVSAFLDGFDDGPEACEDYVGEPPEIVALGVVEGGPAAPAGSGGWTADVAELGRRATADLNDHFGALADAAGSPWTPLSLEFGTSGTGCDEVAGTSSVVFCPARSAVVWTAMAASRVQVASQGALLANVARGWTHGFAEATGAPVDRPALDCGVGAWLGTLHPAAPQREATRHLVLVPTDLDEAVVLALTADDGVDSARALNRGFRDGAEPCSRRGAGRG